MLWAKKMASPYRNSPLTNIGVEMEENPSKKSHSVSKMLQKCFNYIADIIVWKGVKNIHV